MDIKEKVKREAFQRWMDRFHQLVMSNKKFFDINIDIGGRINPHQGEYIDVESKEEGKLRIRMRIDNSNNKPILDSMIHMVTAKNLKEFVEYHNPLVPNPIKL